MADVNLSGNAYNRVGDAVSAATVKLFDRDTITPTRATDTTDSAGHWNFTAGLSASSSGNHYGTDGQFDVEISYTSGGITYVIRRKYDDSIQVEEVETNNLLLRNPADTFKYDIIPAAIEADRALTLPLLTGSATLVVTPGIENMDMAGFALDNVGFVVLNAATAPAGTEVYLVNDNTGDLTLNALSTKTAVVAIAGTDEYSFSATTFDIKGNTITNTGVLTLPTDTDTLVGRATTDTLTNKTLTSPTLTSAVLNTAVSGTAVLDEDDFTSDSNTKVATQQSIKAFIATVDNTSNSINGIVEAMVYG